MTFVGDTLREFANRLGQSMSVVWNLDALSDLRLRLLRGVEHGILVSDELPFERLLRTIDVDALAILSCGIPKETPDVCCDVGVLDLDVTRLDSELRTGPARALVVDRPGAEAADILRHAADHGHERAHDVGRIMHRNHVLPV